LQKITTTKRNRAVTIMKMFHKNKSKI